MFSDPIPGSDSNFNNFVVPFNSYVQSNNNVGAVWMGVTNADATGLGTAVANWSSAYAVAMTPASAGPMATQAKNEARTPLELLLRPMIRQMQANSAMTDDIRAGLGIHIASGTHTRAGVPATAPGLLVDLSQRLQHSISFRDAAGGTSKAKPAGVTGCKIYAKIGLPAPTDVSQMQLLGTATHSPFLQHYDGSQAGQQVTLWACWTNAHDENGPWSAPASATIPG